MRRTAISFLTLASVLGVCASTGIAAQTEPAGSGLLRLTLENGAGQDRAMILDLTLKNNRCDKEVWGRSPAYNRGQHNGDVVSQQIKGSDYWVSVGLTAASDRLAPGGPAKYELTLKREADVFSGTYTGTFVDGPVTGAVAGALVKSPVGEISGFKPLQPGEHPRMIFRKGDVPEMKRRAETPVGQAIMAMLKVRAPLRTPAQLDDRRTSWLGANWGVLHILCDDKDAPEKAKTVIMDEVISRSMPLDRTDIQHATRLLGIALTYDLCYDAWDETFRGLMAQFIAHTALNLFNGISQARPVPDGAVDPDPWKHRNAIRMACIGCAALAVRGDPGLDEKMNREVARMLAVAERDVIVYLQDGVYQTGLGMEGDLYKSLALANGVLQFLHAMGVAAGRDLSEVNPYLLASHVVSARDVTPGSYRFGLASISVQASGRWPMGLGSTPKRLLPAMKWCFDRECGLEGPKHFDCAYPFQAAYALKNYPFDVEARSPDEALPLVMTDTINGHFVFRNRWQDAGDVIVSYGLRYRWLPGLDQRAAPPPNTLKISSTSQDWLSGVVGLRPRNPVLGAQHLYYDSSRPKQSCLGARFDRMYMQATRAERGKPAAAGKAAVQPVRIPGYDDEFVDTGIRCTRHLGVDFSGASGAPALVVVLDMLENADKESWEIGGLTTNAVFQGNTFRVVDPQGVGLRAGLVAPKTGLDGRGRIRGSNLYCLVMTIQSGDPPEVKAEGDGTGLRLQIGGQAVSLKDNRLVFEK